MWRSRYKKFSSIFYENLFLVHNGTIDKRWEHPFPEVSPLCKGDTDSERVLLKISEYMKSGESFEKSCINTLSDIEKNYPDFRSATNIVLYKNPKTNNIAIFASLFFNEKLKISEIGSEIYYSLFLGRDECDNFYICSEALPVKGVIWESLENSECIFSEDLENKNIKRFNI